MYREKKKELRRCVIIQQATSLWPILDKIKSFQRSESGVFLWKKCSAIEQEKVKAEVKKKIYVEWMYCDLS